MCKEYDFSRIDKWLDEHKEEMIRDLARIIKIPSVSRPGEDGYPFGKDCKDVLEEMLQIGREHGFYTENYEDYVGSIGCKEKNLKNTIGFWTHLDIVPVGNNWQYDPFEISMKGPLLFGRGVDDNKGPAIGMLYLMECLRELEVPMKHELRLFLGCDEEKGMRDLRYYAKNYDTPALSIVPDCGFPVCYGEKGILEGKMISKESVSEHISMFKGGIASNMIPDLVEVVLKGNADFVNKAMEELERLGDTDVKVVSSEGELKISYHGISRHSSNPYGCKNAIYGMCRTLLQLSVLPQSDKEIISAIADLASEYLGEVPGIQYRDEISGDTTCASTIIDLVEGKLCLTLNIRYAITANNENDLKALAAFAEKRDLIWDMVSNSGPNYFPKENPIVGLLTDVFNRYTGQSSESYVMGGGTYARKLPNAIAYGLGGIKESEEDEEIRRKFLLPGHGGAHEPDEVININAFIEGIKVFARAMVALNEVEL